MKLIIIILFIVVVVFVGFFGVGGHLKLKRNFNKIAKKFFETSEDKIREVDNFENMDSNKIVDHFTDFILKTNKEIVKFLPKEEQIEKSKYKDLFRKFADSMAYALEFTNKDEKKLMLEFAEFYLSEIDKDFERILFVMNVKK
ncbi:hypothetical protein BMS3Abin15_01055 [bacterium BMS3Abin15]|nr:hypothetical protein BMS3Abin15_01055 [bacterium BMS3Abin15]HDZ86047.1 hypothetical protein [Candidatus Moranbacteria bacterium]